MKRRYESLLKKYLADFPCVVVLGVRQCGKTTLLKTLPQTWQIFDLERRNDFEVFAHDPDLFLRLNPRKVAIDEAQLYPPLFSALRVAIDDRRNETGRFVITGSSSPELLKQVSETLAGRVATIEMAPFSLAETRGTSDSPFFTMLSGGKADFPAVLDLLVPRFSLKEIHRFWFQGGYPEPWLRKAAGFAETWQENYVRTYLQRDVARLFPRLDHARFRRFLHMLGGLSGTVINHSELARALAVSQPTARDYLDIANGTFVWRHLPAYAGRPLKRLVKHPKGFVRDTGLLHHFLRIPDLQALLHHPVMGRSWEGMVIEEILRNLNARGIPFSASHYRTGAGGEIDLVLEGNFGLVPIEIKHAQTIRMAELQALSQFLTDRDCPWGIVINNDERPRRYTERILGIPFSCL
jgi:uncharacterized protein